MSATETLGAVLVFVPVATLPDGLSTGFSPYNLASFVFPSASPCAESLQASYSINKYLGTVEINKPADSNVNPVVCP